MDQLKAEFEKAVERRMKELAAGITVPAGEIRRARLMAAIEEEAKARLSVKHGFNPQSLDPDAMTERVKHGLQKELAKENESEVKPAYFDSGLAVYEVNPDE